MKLKPNIYENGIDYTLSGDCYLPELKLPEETRPIGRWGRLHREYLKNSRPLLYNELLLSGRLQTILADLDEQAAERCRLIVRQMAQAEGITEEIKARDPVRWVQAMNSIRSRAEEIVKAELICC
ncbi:TnpV protein [Anaeromassilibacillus sp. An250]|uniref:TnpV protein n=1 Tax=Anaeromassilibacillus sp. An250 TaxID=1965604 RepID=UPI000B38F2D2|nr:TnpV protein [Anaeromassilibacillus sp. An250]OUO74441.1 TnpV protein [Anaeromassilibacillus sp. An250]